MAAMNYNELAVVVLELIEDTGREVTFEVLSGEAVDPSMPWRGAMAQEAEATHEQFATFVPPSDGLGREMVSPEMLSRVQQVCLVGPSAEFDLNKTTTVIDGGVKWAVDWINELRPANVSLLFAIGLKR